jgi:hypothetical protein
MDVLPLGSRGWFWQSPTWKACAGPSGVSCASRAQAGGDHVTVSGSPARSGLPAVTFSARSATPLRHQDPAAILDDALSALPPQWWTPGPSPPIEGQGIAPTRRTLGAARIGFRPLSSTCYALLSLHGRPSAPHEMDDQRNDRHDEEEVDQPPGHMEGPPAQQPSRD